MKKMTGAVLTASALMLAACGSTGASDTLAATDGGVADAAQTTEVAEAAAGGVLTGDLRSVLLSEALDPANELTSARFEGNLAFTGGPDSDIPGDVSITFTGAYDLANQASELSMDMSGIVDAMSGAGGEAPPEMAMLSGFFSEPLETITIGEQSWMRWGLFSMLTGTENAWIEGDGGDLGDMSLTGLGGAGSPIDMLDVLADADAEVETIGQEQVRGSDTTHYRALVNPTDLVAGMSPEERTQLEADLGATPNGVFPMEFWLDGDGLVHRYRIEFSDGLLADSEDDIESMVFEFEMWDHGADLGISPPPADQVVTEDELNFGFGGDEFDLDA